MDKVVIRRSMVTETCLRKEYFTAGCWIVATSIPPIVPGGCKKLMLFFGGFFCFLGKRTRDFAFVSLCYGRSGEEMCTGYAMAASGRMQYDYKQTNHR